MRLNLCGLPRSGRHYEISAPVPPPMLRFIRSRASNRDFIINILEALALVVALRTFHDVIGARPLYSFLDSTAAFYAFLFGTSASDDLAAHARLVHAILATSVSDYWFEWLPSSANPADAPSRGITNPAARRFHPDWPPFTLLASSHACLQAFFD